MPRNAKINGPDPIDIHVGARIRLARKAQGKSQELVARALGVTFQQLQKYERGSNRVSASMLQRLALRLDRPVAWFFEGLPEPAAGGLEAESASERRVREAAQTPSLRHLLLALLDLDPLDRARLADLAERLRPPAAARREAA